MSIIFFFKSISFHLSCQYHDRFSDSFLNSNFRSRLYLWIIWEFLLTIKNENHQDHCMISPIDSTDDGDTPNWPMVRRQAPWCTLASVSETSSRQVWPAMLNHSTRLNEWTRRVADTHSMRTKMITGRKHFFEATFTNPITVLNNITSTVTDFQLELKLKSFSCAWYAQAEETFS